MCNVIFPICPSPRSANSCDVLHPVCLPGLALVWRIRLLPVARCGSDVGPDEARPNSLSLLSGSIRLRDQHLLVVEDNGPGFPADIDGRVFKRFVKAKHSPGHGLGLAFVDAAPQSHGGGTRVSERPGGGAVVTLSLPVSVLQAA
jgi:two-component sensor histidine kinase